MKRVHGCTRRLIPCAFAFFQAALIALSPAATAAATPETIIDEFHATLIEVMRNGDRLGYQGRYQRLEPVITAHFDTPLIAEVILGRYWSELTPDQQQQFLELFERLSVATYANRFDSFDGESFHHVGTDSLNKGRRLVKTELRRPNDEAVRLDYLMQQRDGKWYIISVVADGVNDLSLKRAEYTAMMKNQGFDALVRELRTKITDLESTSG